MARRENAGVWTPTLPGRLPVTVITGFLGSGKTTLLRRLLSQPASQGTAVIINEIGELPIDNLIVAAPTTETRVLAGGCVCCTARGDLADVFIDLLEQRATGRVSRFSRVIVETTGVADPGSVAASIALEPRISAELAVENIITLVDGVNGLAQLESDDEAVKQAALADRLLISKTDLAHTSTVRRLRSRLACINPFVRAIDCLHGAVDSLNLFNISDSESWLREKAPYQIVAGSHPFPSNSSKFETAAPRHSIHSISLTYDSPIEHANLTMWISLLATFKARDLLRVKALLNVAGRPVIVNGVQHIFHPPTYLEDWPSPNRQSRLVFIWRNKDERDILDTLAAFQLELPTNETQGIAVNPSVYAQFSDLAVRLRDRDP